MRLSLTSLISVTEKHVRMFESGNFLLKSRDVLSMSRDQYRGDFRFSIKLLNINKPEYGFSVPKLYSETISQSL